MSNEKHNTNSDPPVIGVVTSPYGLNVRLAARPMSNVICTIDYNSEVVIDEDKSTDEFYRVCTASGVEGYCMKSCISIKS